MIEDIRKKIAEEKDEIRRRYKAKITGIFGSYARGEFHADSDLDLLVDFDESADLFDFVGLHQFLEEKLACKVDLVPQRALREELRASVSRETIRL